jgi:hypothetical protein
MSNFREYVSRLIGRPQREDFLKHFPQNAIVAEIGVFKGEFSKHILKIAKPQKLILIDAWWKLYGDFYPNWGKYTNYGKLKTKDAYNVLLKTLLKYDKNNVSRIFVDISTKILQSFPDCYFDWVYIDSSHEYKQTKEELAVIMKKVKKNGFILGHDWTEDTNNIHCGVSLAVKEFCKEHNYSIFKIDKFSNWAIKKNNIFL